MNDEQDDSGFKVNDRRRFDEEGNVKEDQAEQEETPEPSADLEASADDAPNFTHQEGSDDSMVNINFASFVASLATQALMQMGEIPPPEGVEIPVDPNAAKQTIDIIVMLKEKTKGNLDQDENFFFRRYVTQSSPCLSKT